MYRWHFVSKDYLIFVILIRIPLEFFKISAISFTEWMNHNNLFPSCLYRKYQSPIRVLDHKWKSHASNNFRESNPAMQRTTNSTHFQAIRPCRIKYVRSTELGDVRARTDGRGQILKGIGGEAQEKRTLPNPRIPDQQQLQQVIEALLTRRRLHQGETLNSNQCGGKTGQVHRSKP